MEEDINFIEETLWDKDIIIRNHYWVGTKFLNAVENLIKGYREKEEVIKALDKNMFKFSNTVVKEYIPKSKIKEKIEELRAIMLDIQTKYKGTYALLDEWRNAKAQENILIELLEEE